jgi:ElaA protein
MNLQWKLKDWNELTTEELYQLLALRIRVFVIEQNCPYQDADGKDLKSLHLFAAHENGEVLACLRLVRPGISFEEWSIGRVVTDARLRNTGAGRQLMKKAMEYLLQQKIESVRISAQSYLIRFYESFGFVVVSDEYPEDNIPHVEMLYKNTTHA